MKYYKKIQSIILHNITPTLNKKYFLKDDPKNKKNDVNMDRIALDIMNMESIIEKERKRCY